MDCHYSTVLVVILLQPNHITEFFDIHQDILQSHEIIPYIWGKNKDYSYIKSDNSNVNRYHILSDSSSFF